MKFHLHFISHGVVNHKAQDAITKLKQGRAESYFRVIYEYKV